jgi:hypothetical protein
MVHSALTDHADISQISNYGHGYFSLSFKNYFKDIVLGEFYFYCVLKDISQIYCNNCNRSTVFLQIF